MHKTTGHNLIRNSIARLWENNIYLFKNRLTYIFFFNNMELLQAFLMIFRQLHINTTNNVKKIRKFPKSFYKIYNFSKYRILYFKIYKKEFNFKFYCNIIARIRISFWKHNKKIKLKRLIKRKFQGLRYWIKRNKFTYFIKFINFTLLKIYKNIRLFLFRINWKQILRSKKTIKKNTNNQKSKIQFFKLQKQTMKFNCFLIKLKKHKKKKLNLKTKSILIKLLNKIYINSYFFNKIKKIEILKKFEHTNIYNFNNIYLKLKKNNNINNSILKIKKKLKIIFYNKIYIKFKNFYYTQILFRLFEHKFFYFNKKFKIQNKILINFQQYTQIKSLYNELKPLLKKIKKITSSIKYLRFYKSFLKTWPLIHELNKPNELIYIFTKELARTRKHWKFFNGFEQILIKFFILSASKPLYNTSAFTGMKLIITGRPQEISRTKKIKFNYGTIKISTFNKGINEVKDTAIAKIGAFGIRILITT